MVKRKIKKVLVIGSNSFSAISMIDLLLKKNYSVFAISRSKLNSDKYISFNKKHKNFYFKKLDLNDDFKKIFKFIKNVKPNYVINYASQSMVGESWDQPIDWYRTNSYSMIKLYQFLTNLSFKIKLIHISTPEVYGNIKNVTYENKIYNPTTPYAASRVTADQFLDLMSAQKKINFCSIRASNVYGEHQRLYRIIPKTIFSILKKKKINLHGGGSSKRNFIHIDDVSDAIFKVMLKGKIGECYHVAGTQLISIKNLVKEICKMMNYKFKDLINTSKERKGKDKYYFLSSKKIRSQLKWKQKILLSKGLQRCINWVSKNQNSFTKKDLNYIHKK